MESGSRTIKQMRGVSHCVTMLPMTPTHGSQSSDCTSTTTTTLPIGSNPTARTRLSVEITGVSFEVTPAGDSSSPKKWHGNRRRSYPFWKPCTVCSTPFECVNRTQAVRNKLCPECRSMRRREPRRKRDAANRPGVVQVECAVCGKVVNRYKSQVARVSSPTCSRECNGSLRGKEWARHAHKGRAHWTEESRAALVERMTGESNPSWHGGAMSRSARGNYAGAVYVRCPSAFLPMSRLDGYVMEHRLVVAQALGRCLTRAEVVHHIDHDPRNNSPANLMLFASNGDHKLYEARGTPLPLWRG